ncbi:MAG TPA: hypothetical protein VGX92_19115 [Pyrinomonadaceae bacterium]|jgi:hypothetical protein|nr:hypothetical protein [Pyrinomonadaceae bacterium]
MTFLTRRNLLLHVVVVCICLTATISTVDAAPVSQAEARPTPTDMLRSARTIFIRTNTIYFKPATLENALLKRSEFQDWGMAITRIEWDADLIIEVDRKIFTTRFVYSVIDRRTTTVVASGKISSLGGTVEGKISDSFIKRMRQVRASPPARTSAPQP